ncbi:hypothetical protein EVAR_73406_1, partial [Eumeta japonica]
MRPYLGGYLINYQTKDSKPPQQPKLDYRSMVSMDDKPGLFVSVDNPLVVYPSFPACLYAANAKYFESTDELSSISEMSAAYRRAERL